MNNKKIIKINLNIIKKALAAFVAGAFLFNDIAFAADFRNLAPQAGVTLDIVKDRFGKVYELTLDKAATKLITNHIEKIGGFENLRQRKDVVRKGAGKSDVEIIVAAIPGLFANLGRNTFTDTGGYGDKPVIFVEANDYRYYDEIILRDAKKKIRSGSTGDIDLKAFYNTPAVPLSRYSLAPQENKVQEYVRLSAAGGRVFPDRTSTKRADSKEDNEAAWSEAYRNAQKGFVFSRRQFAGYSSIADFLRAKRVDIRGMNVYLKYRLLDRAGVIKVEPFEHSGNPERLEAVLANKGIYRLNHSVYPVLQIVIENPDSIIVGLVTSQQAPTNTARPLKTIGSERRSSSGQREENLDVALSVIAGFRHRDFRPDVLRAKVDELLAYRGNFEEGVHDFVRKSVMNMAVAAGREKPDSGRILGLAGEISGLYEILIRRSSTLKNIYLGRLESLDSIVYQKGETVKEFDAVSDNAVFEFKFHLTLRKLYQQVIGMDTEHTPHLKVLTEDRRFNRMSNIVYFGEADDGQVVKALAKFVDKYQDIRQRLFITPEGGVSVKLTLRELNDFLFSPDTIAHARAEERIHSRKFLPERFPRMYEEMQNLIDAKMRQLGGRKFDVIIAMSNTIPEDLKAIAGRTSAAGEIEPNRRDFLFGFAGLPVLAGLAKTIAQANPERGLNVDTSSKLDESKGRWPEEDIRARVLQVLRVLMLHHDNRYNQIEKIERQDLGDGQIRFRGISSRDWDAIIPTIDVIFAKEDFENARLKEERLVILEERILGRRYEDIERHGFTWIKRAPWVIGVGLISFVMAVLYREYSRVYARRIMNEGARESLCAQHAKEAAKALGRSGKTVKKPKIKDDARGEKLSDLLKDKLDEVYRRNQDNDRNSSSGEEEWHISNKQIAGLRAMMRKAGLAEEELLLWMSELFDISALDKIPDWRYLYEAKDLIKTYDAEARYLKSQGYNSGSIASRPSAADQDMEKAREWLIASLRKKARDADFIKRTWKTDRTEFIAGKLLEEIILSRNRADAFSGLAALQELRPEDIGTETERQLLKLACDKAFMFYVAAFYEGEYRNNIIAATRPKIKVRVFIWEALERRLWGKVPRGSVCLKPLTLGRVFDILDATKHTLERYAKGLDELQLGELNEMKAQIEEAAEGSRSIDIDLDDDNSMKAFRRAHKQKLKVLDAVAERVLAAATAGGGPEHGSGERTSATGAAATNKVAAKRSLTKNTRKMARKARLINAVRKTERKIEIGFNNQLEKVNAAPFEIKEKVVKLFDLAENGKEEVRDKNSQNKFKEKNGIDHLKALLVGAKPAWLDFGGASGREIMEFIQDPVSIQALQLLGLDYLMINGGENQGLLLYNIGLVNAVLRRDRTRRYLTDVCRINISSEEIKTTLCEMLKYNEYLIGIILGYRLEDVTAFTSSKATTYLDEYAASEYPGLISPIARDQKIFVTREYAGDALLSYMRVQGGINKFPEMHNRLKLSIAELRSAKPAPVAAAADAMKDAKVPSGKAKSKDRDAFAAKAETTPSEDNFQIGIMGPLQKVPGSNAETNAENTESGEVAPWETDPIGRGDNDRKSSSGEEGIPNSVQPVKALSDYIELSQELQQYIKFAADDFFNRQSLQDASAQQTVRFDFDENTSSIISVPCDSEVLPGRRVLFILHLSSMDKNDFDNAKKMKSIMKKYIELSQTVLFINNERSAYIYNSNGLVRQRLDVPAWLIGERSSSSGEMETEAATMTREAWENHYVDSDFIMAGEDSLWDTMRSWMLDLIKKKSRLDKKVSILEVGGAHLAHALDLRYLLPDTDKFTLTVADMATKTRIPLNATDRIRYISSRVEELNDGILPEKADVVFSILTLEFSDIPVALERLKSVSNADADFVFVMHHPFSPMLRRTKMDLARWEAAIAARELGLRYLMGELDFNTFRRQVLEVLTKDYKEFKIQASVDYRFRRFWEGFFEKELKRFDGFAESLRAQKTQDDGERMDFGFEKLASELTRLKNRRDLYKAKYKAVLDMVGGHNAPFRSVDEVHALFERHGFVFKQSFGVSPDNANEYFFFHCVNSESKKSVRRSSSGAIEAMHSPLIAEPFTEANPAEPAEWLRTLRDNDALLAAVRGEEGVAAPSEVERLEEVGVVEKAGIDRGENKGEEGDRYRLTGIMKEPDSNHAMAMINLVNDVSAKFNNESPEFVKEMIRAYMVDYTYKGVYTKPEKSDYAIRIWKDYGANSQKSAMQEVARRTEGKIKFDTLENLVNFAEGCKDGTVTILPRNKLSPEQKARLDKPGVRVIYVDLDKGRLEADELGALEGLIGIGRAYLNDDEKSFYKLYNLLAEKPVSDYVSLADLKANPIYFIDRLKFVLKPIKAHNLNDLPRLNRELKKLLESA